jgi:hypothetical protein
MKKILTESLRVLLIGAALVLTPLGAVRLLAQDPTAELLTIPVTGKVVKDGLTYSFTGTVTFPKPAAPVPLPGPAFCGLHDAAGNYLRAAAPGSPVIAQGRDFGTARGKLFWGAIDITVIEWTDTAIKFNLPLLPLHPRGHLLTIHRADGAWASEVVILQQS